MGEWNLACPGEGMVVVVPDGVFGGVYRKGGTRNYTDWTNPKVEALFELQKLERGLDLLVVDYLQLVQGRQRWGQSNRVQEITEISRELKVLAGDLKVALIACSQLNRMVESRPNNRPRLSDLRDSGSIEQDADVVMFIHREDVYVTEEEWNQMHPGQEYPKNIAEIIIAKHRKGPTGSILLKFIDNLVRFDSV